MLKCGQKLNLPSKGSLPFHYCFFGLVVILSCILFYPGLFGDFEFDDGPNILLNKSLVLPSLDVEYLLEAAFSFSTESIGRPVSMLSFALNQYYSGFNPFWFKLTNLGIHIICGILIYTFTLNLLRCYSSTYGRFNDKADQRWLSLALMLAWLLAPINLSPVLYVVQRMASLCALFSFASLTCYLLARTSLIAERYLNTLILALLTLLFGSFALLSKEIAVLLPLYVLLIEIFVLRFKCPNSKLKVTLVFLVTMLSLVPVFLTFGKVLLDPGWLEATYSIREFSPIQRVLTELRVLWFYIFQTFLPINSQLGIYHDSFVYSRSLFDPISTFVSLIGFVSLALFAFRMRRRWPLISLGIAWFFVAHSLEASFISLELVHEHRNYIASFGLYLVAAYCLLSKDFSLSFNHYRLTIFALFICLSVVVTGFRANMWGDLSEHAKFELINHPDSTRANYQYGRLLLMTGVKTGDTDRILESVKYFQTASELNKNDVLAIAALVFIHEKYELGNLELEELTKQLEHRLRETRIHTNAAGAVKMLIDLRTEDESKLKNVDLDRLINAGINNEYHAPRLKASWLLLKAKYLSQQKVSNIEKVRELIERAIESAPRNIDNRILYVNFLSSIGEWEQALTELQEIKTSKLSWTKPQIDFYEANILKSISTVSGNIVAD